MPTFTQTAFSQPAVHTQHTHPAQTNQTGQHYPNKCPVSNSFQQFQQPLTLPTSKISYPRKEKMKYMAMKISTWIQMLIIIFEDFYSKNNPKRLGKDAKEIQIVHPSCFLLKNMFAVSKGEIKDIWKALRARLVEMKNQEDKKTMLKQQFSEFLCDRRKANIRVMTGSEDSEYSAFKVTEVKLLPEFAMMGISPKAQKEKKEWEVNDKSFRLKRPMHPVNSSSRPDKAFPPSVDIKKIYQSLMFEYINSTAAS
ncbi:hypothetical protein Tco_0347625 [Tanacetum coccineum]